MLKPRGHCFLSSFNFLDTDEILETSSIYPRKQNVFLRYGPGHGRGPGPKTGNAKRRRGKNTMMKAAAMKMMTKGNHGNHGNHARSLQERILRG